MPDVCMCCSIDAKYIMRFIGVLLEKWYLTTVRPACRKHNTACSTIREGQNAAIETEHCAVHSMETTLSSWVHAILRYCGNRLRDLSLVIQHVCIYIEGHKLLISRYETKHNLQREIVLDFSKCIFTNAPTLACRQPSQVQV